MECSEKFAIPLLALIAITGQVITLCSRDWIQGSYGDVVVIVLSPWRLCHLNCLDCSTERPSMVCFWIPDWSETGFETYSVVAHLEYWCLGFLTLSLLLSLLDCAQEHLRRLTKCPIDFAKPTLLLLIVACLLSTISVSLFGAKLRHQTGGITTFDDVTLRLAWAFYLRMASALSSWLATAASICNQCRSVTATNFASDSDTSVLVVTSPIDDPAGESEDEAEQGALL